MSYLNFNDKIHRRIVIFRKLENKKNFQRQAKFGKMKKKLKIVKAMKNISNFQK